MRSSPSPRSYCPRPGPPELEYGADGRELRPRLREQRHRRSQRHPRVHRHLCDGRVRLRPDPGSLAVNALFLVFLATLMVPQQLTIIPLYVIMGRLQLVDTLWALISAGGALQRLRGVPAAAVRPGIPVELEEAAAIDGANRVRIFITIILPLLRTPMVALGIFVFLSQWNSFFYPLIFLNSDANFTLPLLVNQFKGAYSSDWGSLMAAVTLAAAPLLIIFILAQRQIVEGIALSGLQVLSSRTFPGCRFGVHAHLTPWIPTC